MKKTLFLLALLLFADLSFAQVINRTHKDSILTHKAIYDKQGKIVPWYKPEVSGAGYSQVIKLASEWLRDQCPKDPKSGLPLYLVTCCFQGPHMRADKKTVGEEWYHNPACTYAGCVQSFAVDYYNFTGDASYIELVRGMLDYQLEHGTTEEGWVWSKVPYASSDPFATKYEGGRRWDSMAWRGDGYQGIEPDKVGELGYGYLRFYEITGEEKYLEAAINCADALAKNVRNVLPAPGNFNKLVTEKSPWPFRVNARSGMVLSEYCSHVITPIMLFDEALRIKDRIKLDPQKIEKYKRARQLAWDWMFSTAGPMYTYIWNGYFEDIENDPDRTNRTQITPGEVAKYLIRNPHLDKDIDKDVPAMIHWIRTAFKTDGMDAIREQTWCYEPMGSHTARYGAVCAMWYERTGDEWFKEEAYRHLNFATYMTLPDGIVAVGPTWPGSWFSDGYSDYVRHYIDALAAVPEWAPAGENHLLRSTSVVKSISYAPSKVEFSTYDSEGNCVLRMKSKPKSLSVNGKALKESKELASEGWIWQPLKQGGVVRMNYKGGNKVEIGL